MSHLGRKYQDLDTSQDRIMHSTPKYGRDSYDSRVTSYVPGELRRSSENDLSNTTEQVSRNESVTVRSGVSRSVSQHVTSSDASSSRDFGFTSDEGRKGLQTEQSMKAVGNARSSALNLRRESGDALLERDNLSGDSILKSSLMETSRSRYTSGASRKDKYGGGINRNEHSMASKPTEMGFQYEDIQSFRDRQKIEGDRLQVHRGSLSGDIVGMVKKQNISSPDSGYSSGVATDLEKSREGNIHSYSSSVREYKSSYGDYGGSRPSSDKILEDAKRSGGASGVSHLHSSIITQDYKSSGDDRSDRFSKDRMLENEKGKTSDDVPLSSRRGVDYKLSSDRGVSDTDRSKLLRDLKSDSKDVTTQLHTRHSDYKSFSANDSMIPRDERFSKTDALVAKYLDSSRYKSKRGSDLDFEHKHLSSLTEIKEEEKVDGERQKHKEYDISEKHHSVSGKPTSYLPKESSYKELLKKKKEDSSPKSSEASSVLDKREISSQSKFTYGDISCNTDLKSDYKDSRSGYLPGSSGKIGERPELPRRLSYDWQDDRKARQQAIDRLLDSTRRYSVDSILDRTSHDKKLDDVIDAMTTKDLDSSTSHVERHVRETKIGGKPDITGKSRVDDMFGSTGVYHRRLSNKTSSEMDTDRKFTGGGDYERIGMNKENEKARDNVTPVEMLPKNEDKSRAPYETPYTSLDHSHYKPNAFGVNVDHDDRIYAVPLKTSKHPEKNKPESSHPDFSDKQIGGTSGKTRPDYPPAYEPSFTSNKPNNREEVIYDKLRRGSGPLEKPLSTNLNTSKNDNRRGSIEGLDEPIYERLYLSSNPEPRSPKTRDSPVPMSDHFGLPLDKYNKPVALHGKTGEPANPDDKAKGRDIVSRHPERQLIDRPRGGDFSDFVTDEVSNVTETTRTSYMQRSFVSRNGEVIKDEVKRHDEIRHDGQNAIEEIEEKRIDPEIPTRIQRYPAAKRDEIERYDLKTELRDTKKTTEDKRAIGVTPDDHKLDEIMKLTGLENKGDVTKYHEHSRRDDVTRIHDDSNIRTKVHKSDVDTKVNIVKEISAPKKDKPASRRSGIADLRSKIEALTKSVDELMDYKKRTLLRSYVKEHAERPSSKDIEERLPKVERYEVKSKRYEPKDIEQDQVDYVYKKLDLEEMPRKPEHTNVELNIKSLWLSEEDQTGKDIGLHIPKQINLAPENRTVEWWNADTAEAADRFLCIGDWRWWNANTTEGVDHILGIQAINKETGATGAIIAKYQGEEKPIEWAWLEASNQPSAAEKRRTLTRVLMIDRENEGSDWSNSANSHDTNQYLSIGNLNWWDASTTEGVDQILGVRGSSKETGTILATYDESTKPNAWTWVQTSRNVPEIKVEKKHTITRSSRDIYVDETDNGKVELLIRVKDEETTDPRYIAIRPGPIEKAIIVHQALESEMPYTKNLRVEGKQGEGLQVKNGVVQMKIKDMTPEARQAWMQIMGIPKRQMKLHENETVEIPVEVIDKPHNAKSKEDLYAVPIKKKKNKQPVSTSVKVEEKKKLEQKKSTEVEKKKKEKKESETEKKKKEIKLKKIEAEKTKKKEVEKKQKEELEKKKKEEKIKLDKKRMKDIQIQKKKRESEKLKEKEMERKRKEQLKSKEVVFVKKEKVAKEDMPPPVDRSTKPKQKVVRDTYTQEIRRHSDVVDAGMGQRSEQFQRGSSKRMSHVDASARHYGSVPSTYGNKIKSSKTVTKVQGGSFSPKKSGPFVTAGGRVVTPKAQSARARMTSSTQNQSVKTEFEERSNLTRKQSPSVKVVKRVSVTQSGKTRPYSTDQTTSIQHKSGSIRRRSGGSIAVPLRGGSSKQTNSSVKIIGSQSVKGQLPLNQHTRQTTVEESHHYRTETHITSDDGRAVSPGIHAVAPQLATVGQVGPGHFEVQHIGLGHVGESGHVGGAPVMGGHFGGQVGGGNIGGRQAGGEHAGAGSVVLPYMPTETSTDYSYNASDSHQLPDGTYVQRDVSHIRRTDWSVQEMSTKGQSKC